MLVAQLNPCPGNIMTLPRLSPLISVRFTYIISDWPEEDCFLTLPPNLDAQLGSTGAMAYSELTVLPYGLLYDPIR